MTAIQKAREALEAVKTALARHDLALARREHGDVAAGHCIDDIRSALAALDAETPATPADVGELVERLREIVCPQRQRPIITETVTALERVVRERDEAHELKAHARKCCDEAEAKLAEARKVIERYESGLNTLATTFYKDDQHQDYAKHVLDHRFLEETK